MDRTADPSSFMDTDFGNTRTVGPQQFYEHFLDAMEKFQILVSTESVLRTADWVTIQLLTFRTKYFETFNVSNI